MDPMLMGIGPYSYMGLNNDMTLLPIIQQYQGAVAQMDGAAEAQASMDSTYTGVPGIYPSYNSDEYWLQMEKTQDRMMNNTIRQNQRWNQQTAEINGPMYKVADAADVLHDKILENEQDQIQGALQAYKNAIKEAYYQGQEVDDDMLTAQAKTQYQTRFGTRIDDDLRNNSTSPFWNGFIHSATFGLFGDETSSAENIAKINNQPVSSKPKTWKKTGKVLGNCTAGVVGGALAGGTIGAIGGPIGAGAGAVIGGIVGLIKGLFS